MRINLAPFLKTSGLLLITYGLIREAFGQGIPGGVAARSGADAFLIPLQEFAFRLGGGLGLIPEQHALTAMEHRFDAESAIIGFGFLVIGSLISFIQFMRNR